MDSTVPRLLAAWRDAERRLDEADDPEVAVVVRREVERLRDEYRAAVNDAAAAPPDSHAPEQPLGL